MLRRPGTGRVEQRGPAPGEQSGPWNAHAVVEIADAADPRLADYRDLTDVALRRVLEPDGRAVHRRVGQGDRPGARRRSSPALGPRAGEVGGRRRRAARRRHRTSRCTSSPAEVAEHVTGYAVHRGALASMHRPALPSVARRRRGRAHRRDPRGHRRSHERRRGVPQRPRASGRMPCSCRRAAPTRCTGAASG